MDKKLLLVGLATMSLVVISTLALVGLLIKPEIFGVKLFTSDTLSVKFDPRLDSIRQDSIRRATLEQNVYIYDKLNYTLTTLSLKREKLILEDSIYKIWKIVDNYKMKVDSVNKVLNIQIKSADSLRKAIVKLTTKEVKEVPKIEYSTDQVLSYAKAYEVMDPAIAAKQLQLMPEEDALEILINIQPRPAAKILDKIEPIKAAKFWLILNSKKKR
jgi:hypothetical protein